MTTVEHPSTKAEQLQQSAALARRGEKLSHLGAALTILAAGLGYAAVFVCAPGSLGFLIDLGALIATVAVIVRVGVLVNGLLRHAKRLFGAQP